MTQQRLAYDVNRACELMSLSKPSLYQFIQSGELRSFQVGRKRLISHQALTDFISQQEALVPPREQLDHATPVQAIRNLMTLPEPNGGERQVLVEGQISSTVLVQALRALKQSSKEKGQGTVQPSVTITHTEERKSSG